MQDVQIPEDKGNWYASFSPLADTIYERGRKLLENEETDQGFNLITDKKK